MGFLITENADHVDLDNTSQRTGHHAKVRPCFFYTRILKIIIPVFSKSLTLHKYFLGGITQKGVKPEEGRV